MSKRSRFLILMAIVILYGFGVLQLPEWLVRFLLTIPL